MSIYSFYEGHQCRRFLRSAFVPYERKRCSCGVMPPTPENRKKYVDLSQGSFVSNILWNLVFDPYVSEELMEALQRENFEGIAYEPTEIVTDSRPSRDRKKLPLHKIPPFYRVKCLTSMELHPDYIEAHDFKFCSLCGAESSKYTEEPVILDKKSQPDSDFFLAKGLASTLCTERGKAFLENYPKTYCHFSKKELRD